MYIPSAKPFSLTPTGLQDKLIKVFPSVSIERSIHLSAFEFIAAGDYNNYCKLIHKCVYFRKEPCHTLNDSLSLPSPNIQVNYFLIWKAKLMSLYILFG